MKIVICDDNLEDLIRIEKLLHRYMESCTDIGIEIDKYSDPSKLYDKICRQELADIYILDMLMAEKTGIDIGSRIRKAGCQSMIIYITSSDDFALEAYRVHAARYLLKPVKEADFFEALDHAVSGTKIKNDPVYSIKTKNGPVSIPYSKIEYIENASRMLDIHLLDGNNIKSIFIRKSFDMEIESLLHDGDFLQVHKSFAVNLKYIRKLMQNNILMESGKNIPISKSRIAAVKKEYLLFVSGQYS